MFSGDSFPMMHFLHNFMLHSELHNILPHNTTLAQYNALAMGPSICSSPADFASKWLNAGSRKQHRRIAGTLVFWCHRPLRN